MPTNEAEVAVCAATASVLGKDGGLLGSPRRFSGRESWKLKVHLKEFGSDPIARFIKAILVFTCVHQAFDLLRY